MARGGLLPICIVKLGASIWTLQCIWGTVNVSYGMESLKGRKAEAEQAAIIFCT